MVKNSRRLVFHFEGANLLPKFKLDLFGNVRSILSYSITKGWGRCCGCQDCCVYSIPRLVSPRHQGINSMISEKPYIPYINVSILDITQLHELIIPTKKLAFLQHQTLNPTFPALSPCFPRKKKKTEPFSHKKWPKVWLKYIIARTKSPKAIPTFAKAKAKTHHCTTCLPVWWKKLTREKDGEVNILNIGEVSIHSVCMCLHAKFKKKKTMFLSKKNS